MNDWIINKMKNYGWVYMGHDLEWLDQNCNWIIWKIDRSENVDNLVHWHEGETLSNFL
jgi:hypothetical protein